MSCFTVPFPIQTFVDFEGNPLANGYLLIRLMADCQCPCLSYQTTSNYARISLNGSGVISGTPQFRPNNQLLPLGSYYILEAYSAIGQLCYGPVKITV